MIDTITPNSCWPDSEVGPIKNSSLLSKMVSAQLDAVNDKENFLLRKNSEIGKLRNRGSKRKSYLDPLLLKLDNVIAKYQLKKSHLEDVYMGVVGCGFSRCEKFKNLIPENQRLRRLHCFKKKKNAFKVMISDLLSSFHSGVQRIDKSFQVLINFERWPQLNNRSRRKILEDFKVDIKTLNVEIETAMANKRLILTREHSQVAISSHFQKPENQTHLMIYEWRIIQASKRFLRDWQKNLRKMAKCWRRRREKLREKRTGNG